MPTAGYKSIPNSRGESKEQKEQCQVQVDTYEENNQCLEERPMTRNKDTGHQHLATEQEVKVAEKAREHQVEIEAETEIEEQKAAELNKRFREEQQHKSGRCVEGCDTETT